MTVSGDAQIHLRAEGRAGRHVTVGVFAGPSAGNRARLGEVMFQDDEWETLCGSRLADAEHRDVTLLVEVSNHEDLFRR